MSTKIMIALMDRATEAFKPAVTVETRGVALRSFKDEVNNPESPIHQHPTDYELWQVAEFDDQTGAVTPKLEKLARAEDLKGA